MPSAVVTAIAAQKGGTGKTALTGSLGPLWAYTGARTLMIDLDQQANLTFAFAVDPATLDATIVDVLAPRNAVPVDEATIAQPHHVPNLDLLPCDERAAELDTQLRSETMGVYKLSEALGPLLKRYDRIFIDCPPNLGELTVSALLVADEVICPVNLGDRNALPGLNRLTQTITKLRRHGARVQMKTLVQLNCDERERSYGLNRQKLTGLAEHLAVPIAQTELRSRAAWRTAATQDVPMILFEDHDRGTRDAQADLHHLVRELWPGPDFLHASEIRAERAARVRKAAA